MKKAKIIIEGSLLDKIANSIILSNKEKINFFKYIGYMTREEKMQLSSII